MVLEEEFLTPEGYHFTSKIRYPRNFFKAVGLLTPLPALPLYILSDLGMFLPLNRGELNSLLLLTFLFPAITRGIIQRGVRLLLGYSFSWPSPFSTFFITSFPIKTGEYWSYRDAMLVALAPLSLYIALLIPLLLGHWGTIGNMLTFVLLMGFVPTIIDIYLICRLLPKSRSVVLYIRGLTTWVFEPLSAEQLANEGTEAHIPEQPRRRRHRKSHHH